MQSLISEIQCDALDINIPVESLLRRVKLAAAKLQLETLEVWVDQELSGYLDEIPSYREAYGQPAAFHSYNGWLPVHVPDDRIFDLISIAKIKQSISSLRDLIDTSDPNTPLHFPVPDSLVAELNKIMKFKTARMVIQISRGNIVGILDQVRNMVLDWAIKMEKEGVLGEGMSFSAREQEEAKQAMANFNIGNIGSFIGNMGSGNTTGDISASDISKGQIVELTSKIKSSLHDLKEAGVDTDQLAKTITAIEQEAESDVLNPSRIQNLLSEAKTILIGATGNLTAEGAIAGINGLLKLINGG